MQQSGDYGVISWFFFSVNCQKKWYFSAFCLLDDGSLALFSRRRMKDFVCTPFEYVALAEVHAVLTYKCFTLCFCPVDDNRGGAANLKSISVEAKSALAELKKDYKRPEDLTVSVTLPSRNVSCVDLGCCFF